VGGPWHLLTLQLLLFCPAYDCLALAVRICLIYDLLKRTECNLTVKLKICMSFQLLFFKSYNPNITH
jgi:hypothetical protein